MKKRLFLIDGSALAYRSYFAFIRNPLINSKGENNSAVFGFANTLRTVINQQNPDYLMVAFDTGAPTFRHQKFPAYKATRQKMPDEMRNQLPSIKRLIQAFNIKSIEKDGIEADDIIGSIATKASKEDFEVYIVTGDKDFMQIIDDKIKIYDMKSTSGEMEVYDREGVKNKFGVYPEQIIDMLGLMGDSSDNIPGVAQVGPKTALKLLQDFKSIEDIYNRIDEVKPDKLKEKLLQNKENAFLSKDLATIDINSFREIDIEELKYDGPDKQQLGLFYQEFEFFKFLKDLDLTQPAGEVNYKCVKTFDEFESFYELLKKQTCFVFDTETDSLSPIGAKLVGISFSFNERDAYYIPSIIESPTESIDFQDDLFAIKKSSSFEEVLQKLKPIFENPKIKKVGHNIKYDIMVLDNYGINLQGVYSDTMIASYLLRPTARQHNLDIVSMFYLNFKKIPTSDLIGKGKDQINMEDVAVDKVCEYSCEDADITYRLNNLLLPQLESADLSNLFHNLEMPLVEVLKEMESTGVKIDTDHLNNMSGILDTKLKELEKEIYLMAGEEFNINSPQQLGIILFEKLKIHKEIGITNLKKTKIGYRTDSQVLESLEGHPFPKKILEYRQFMKLKSTYIDSLPKLINKKTGRLHTSFNQTVTATGRLSSSDPNLQNIPVRTEIGKQIRKAFIAPSKAYKLLSADYSQIELRILAHLSNDQTLIESFRSGLDIHAKTASLIFNVPLNEITSQYRSRAKAINFGIIYGMGQTKLANETGITQKEAREFIDSYFKKYPGIKLYIDETLDKARRQGYVTTILNRKRDIPEIHSENAGVKVNAEHIAVNTPIQGSSADMIKLAMINIHRKLKENKFKTKMILQIHDELLFEVPVDEIDSVTPIIKSEMETAIKLNVPVIVDIEYGNNWMEMYI